MDTGHGKTKFSLKYDGHMNMSAYPAAATALKVVLHSQMNGMMCVPASVVESVFVCRLSAKRKIGVVGDGVGYSYLIHFKLISSSRSKCCRQTVVNFDLP